MLFMIVGIDHNDSKVSGKGSLRCCNFDEKCRGH